MNTIYSALIVASSLMLSSCSTDQLPVGTSIVVMPSEKSFNMGRADPDTPLYCVPEPDAPYQDVPVQISVVDAHGTPMGDVELLIYTDFSANSFSGPDVLRLYADSNDNGVIDEKVELVNGHDSGVYKTKTDLYHGTAMVLVRMNLSCPYLGELHVFSGSTSNVVEFEVKYSTE